MPQASISKTPAEQLLIKLRLKVSSIGKYNAIVKKDDTHTTVILSRKDKYEPRIAISKLVE